MDCKSFQELNSLYALDALGDAEGRALEAHVATCAACASDLAAMREVAAVIGYGAPAVPVPADVKARLMARIAAEVPTRPGAPAPVPVRRAGRLWEVASFLLAAGLLAAMVRLNALQADLAAVRAKNVALVAQAAVAQERLAALGARDVQVVSLAGQPGAPDSAARLFWSPQRNAWLLTIAALPPAGPGKTYQLWAVTPDAKLSMGTFEPNAAGAAVVETKLERPARPVAAAISIEPAGGVPQPTGPIVMLGNL
jgi:anti-sigma-K factor RskA